MPVSITLDGDAASHRAVRELPLLEGGASAVMQISQQLGRQGHRGVKSRIKLMLGFKAFDRAAVTIAGVELLHRIRNGQLNLHWLRIEGQAAPGI
jgi:transposase-like protein